MNKKNKRLLELLILVGYSIEFPTTLAKRLSGHWDWNRHVMYRAINEGYVDLMKKKDKRHVIRSLSLTSKGLEYIEQRDPESLAAIYSRMESIGPVYPSQIDKIRRLHSIAGGLVMAKLAGARILAVEKPYLTVPLGSPGELKADPDKAYYYSPFEIRSALVEMDRRAIPKSSRLIGIIVRGQHCYCMYNTGRSRMFWMRLTEENHASTIRRLLNQRSFEVKSLSQIVIGSNMGVAAKLCRSPNQYKDRFFIVSRFYDSCHFLTDNAEGDALLPMIVFPEKYVEFTRQVLAPYSPPKVITREYDAIDIVSNRPVILNHTCDLLLLSAVKPAPRGFSGGPIMLCYDYQAQTVQNILGSPIEVRPILRET